MNLTNRSISSSRIRKVEFEYDGSNESFNKFLTALAFDYLQKEEGMKSAADSVQSVEVAVIA